MRYFSIKFLIIIFLIFFFIFSFFYFFTFHKTNNNFLPKIQISEERHPLSIKAMREKNYPGSELAIEEELSFGENYNTFIASYKSEELKIYSLLTIPIGEMPKDGWPVIIFNHGYIPPEQYTTTERYQAYVDAFASKGYIVLKPDYRGHGKSEGKPEGAYYSPAYATDVLNAVSSIKKLKDPSTGFLGIVNINKIGMWGHSMGGNITIRSMVVNKDIKAGVIWGGVVGSYDELMNRWRRSVRWQPSEREQMSRRPGRQTLIEKYGDLKENPSFWQSIDPTFFVSDISGPIQLHHGKEDESVPWEFSQSYKNRVEKEGGEVELYLYEGADHNISSPNFELAMERSISFFDKYLKSL